MLANLKIADATFLGVDVPELGILVLPENKRRFFAMIQNVSNQDIWIMFSSQGAVGDGILIPKGGFSYQIDRNNLWQGEVYAIHGGTGDKTVKTLDCN